MSTDKTELLLKLYPGIAELDEDVRSRLIACAKTVSVPTGAFAFHKGDPCTNFIFVLEGQVRVQLSSEGGREIILYRVQRGGTCALTTSCLIGKEGYPAESVIEEAVTAMMLPATDFRQALLDSEKFRQFVFQGFSKRLCAVVARMETVALKTIDERLAEQLLRGEGGSLSNITHQVLAAEIGTAREVVSRKLKRFESDGLIRASRGKVEILDREKLQALSGTTGP
ncbi:MAG: Crp/Fnr family transcriptional regulator [Gammaproteobacteria bacterium]|nr:Crp/Fnr family transcriptional regulator [Gammaproteobacteria bacterium]